MEYPLSLVQNIDICLAYDEQNNPYPEHQDDDIVIQREEYYGEKVAHFLCSLPEKFRGEGEIEARTSLYFHATGANIVKDRHFNAGEFLSDMVGFMYVTNLDFNFKNLKWEVV